MNLVRDAEAVEVAAWADMYAAAPQAFCEAVGLSCRRFDSALAVSAAKIPDTQFSRAFGFGVDTPATERELDDVIAHMHATGAQKWWLQPSPDQADLIAGIEARGFAATPRPWAKLVRMLDTPAQAHSALVIEAIGAKHGDAFGAIVCEAFGAPPPLSVWLKALVGRANWRCYVAFDNGSPISAATMWSDGDLAWYGIAGTSAAGRGRGGQTAVLARLINDAREAGARMLVAETGVRQTGAVSTSYDNMIRQGFTLAYARANYAPPQ